MVFKSTPYGGRKKLDIQEKDKIAFIENVYKSGRVVLNRSNSSLKFDGATVRDLSPLIRDPQLSAGCNAGQLALAVLHKEIGQSLVDNIKRYFMRKNEERIAKKRRGQKIPKEDFFPVCDWRNHRKNQLDNAVICTKNEGRLETSYGSYEIYCREFFEGDNEGLKRALEPIIGEVEYRPFTDTGEFVERPVLSKTQLSSVRYVNTWSEPVWWSERNELQPYFPKKIQDFLNHLFMSDEDQIEIFLWNLRELLLGRRPENVCIFVGAGGIGKSTLFHIMANLMGKDNVNTTNTRDVTRDGFNSELFDKSLNIFEESDVNSGMSNVFKMLTNTTARRRELYVTARSAEFHAQNWILANKETNSFNVEPNERRYFAFRLTDTPITNAFAHEPDSYEKIKSPDEYGNFYRYLTEVWQPAGPATSYVHAITDKTPEFFRLIINGNPELHKPLAVLLQLMENERIGLGRVKFRERKVGVSFISMVIQTWSDAGVTIGHIEDDNFIRTVDSLNDLIYCRDPFNYRQIDIPDEDPLSEEEFDWDDL